MSNTRIAFIGAGNMAASLIGGLRAKGLDATQIRASDPGADTRQRQASTASKPSPITPRPSRAST
jgi:pyrroline-5-carboxylate reductase